MVTGGIAALCNIGSRYIFSLWLPLTLAVICAYAIGMITAFILMRTFVFEGATRSLRHQTWFFVAVNLTAVLQTVLITNGLVIYVFSIWDLAQPIAEGAAHLIGVTVPVFTSYLGHKFYTFK